MKWFNTLKPVKDHPGFVSAARKQSTITTEIQVTTVPDFRNTNERF